jgi:hypothetical protein
MTRSSSEPLAGVAADRGVLLGSPTGARRSAPKFLRAFIGGDARIRVLERYGALAARILISQIFILSGVMKVMDPAGTAAQMEGRGMFWIPFFLWTAAAVEIGAGLCRFGLAAIRHNHSNGPIRFPRGFFSRRHRK